MKSILISLALLFAGAFATEAIAHDGKDHAAAAAPAASSAATRAALRDLWVEHVFWVRNYVIASADKNANEQKVAADEVVENAKAISGAVAGFYGKDAGDALLKLLAGHWGAIKDYSDATFRKDTAAAKAASDKLVANAKEIAAFLAKANPYLPEATLVSLLSAHGAHHLSQIQQVSSGDYTAEARTWAAMRKHMLTIADALGDALVRQFPDKA